LSAAAQVAVPTLAAAEATAAAVALPPPTVAAVASWALQLLQQCLLQQLRVLMPCMHCIDISNSSSSSSSDNSSIFWSLRYCQRVQHGKASLQCTCSCACLCSRSAVSTPAAAATPQVCSTGHLSVQRCMQRTDGSGGYRAVLK
jgi:hypothetical protein